MESETPQIRSDEMYRLLREERIEEFNGRRAQGESCDLTGADLRGLDLRGLDTEGLALSNSYLRNTDLRGLNLKTCRLEGASILHANISGTYFPVELSSGEILLSHTQGTRMRYGT